MKPENTAIIARNHTTLHPRNVADNASLKKADLGGESSA